MPYVKAILFLFITNAAIQAATMSLKAVRVNGLPIAPTNSLTASPGDRIEAEILISGWGGELPSGVGGYSAMIDIGRGQSGSILPPGWPTVICKAPMCDVDADCPPGLACCGRCCLVPDEPGAFVTKARADFIFHDCENTTPSVLPCGGSMFAGTSLDCDGVLDTGLPRYAGTLLLDVSKDACGVFVFQFRSPQSLLAGTGPDPILVPPVRERLSVIIGGCGPQLLSCAPPHCMIDARIPFDPYSSIVIPWPPSMYMTFSGPTAGMTASQFEVTVVPFQEGDIIPAVVAVTAQGNEATVMLNRRFQQTRWTCIRHIPSDRRCCIGNLPGDANWNRISNLPDVWELLDNLTGEVDPPLTLVQCDTDRSLTCAPADILMAIDLLNGAGRFDPVDGNVLPVCPSTTP